MSVVDFKTKRADKAIHDKTVEAMAELMQLTECSNCKGLTFHLTCDQRAICAQCNYAPGGTAMTSHT
jgi:hypothetical protein